eukprot:115740-Pyramimonas_sp.AAC.1
MLVGDDSASHPVHARRRRKHGSSAHGGCRWSSGPAQHTYTVASVAACHDMAWTHPQLINIDDVRSRLLAYSLEKRAASQEYEIQQ